MDNFQIGTLVRRNKDYGIWHIENKDDFFTVVGEVIGIDYDKKVVKVRWPDGRWFNYKEPKKNFIIVKRPKQWSLPDELFEI